MTIRRLLTQRADLLESGEVLDPATRQPTETRTAVHTDVPAAAVKRADRDVVFDEGNQIAVDYDVILIGPLDPPPAEGMTVRVVAGEPGGTFLIVGEPRRGVRRIVGDVVHYTAPARRTGA